MALITWTDERLSRAAAAWGIKRSSSGSWGTPGGKVNWQMSRGLDGWMVLRRPFAIDGRDCLAEHSDWAGPVKLVEMRDGVEQRVEFMCGRSSASEDDPAIDQEQAEQWEKLVGQLLHAALGLEGQSSVAGWQPPEAKLLASWLAGAGHEVAVDQEQNLRLTLKRHGCDGQVRAERGEGRLRFVLPLGHWNELDDQRERAMRRMVGHVNSHSRLVRIAWLGDGGSRRAEAQVDLSGFPTGADLDAAREAIWRQTVCATIGGLELALRQLGLELPTLADPHNRVLVELLIGSPFMKGGVV